MCRQTLDANRDGKPDTIISFNKNEEKKQVESDTDLNGKTDTWQYYQKGILDRIEKDESNSGKVDLKVYYQGGAKQKAEKDGDDDGFFEITQQFDQKPWSLVTTQDINQDGHAELKLFYKNGACIW